MNGKFIRTIGRIGQGPGEDPALYMGSLFTKGHFYSYGHKLIEYDENGKFTGNEIQLLSNTKSEFEAPGQLGRIDGSTIGLQQETLFQYTIFRTQSTL